MNQLKTLIILFAVIFSSVPSLFAEDTMKFVYFDNFPPLSWMDSGRQMQGILTDIVDEAIQKQMNIAVSHSGYPWARAQMMVRQGVADAFITIPTPERKEYTKVSNESVIVTNMTLFTSINNEKMEELKKIRKISDLKPFKLLDYLGDGWAKKNLSGFNVDWCAKLDNVLLKLAHKRGDLFVQSAQQTYYKIKELGLKDQIVEIPTVLDSADFHLCIGNNSSFINIISNFDQIIRDMRKDGRLQAIYDKYK